MLETILVGLQRTDVFLIMSLLLFVTLIVLLVGYKAKGATHALVGAVVCGFMSQASTYELFKFSATGFEARASKAVTNAEAATEALRNVAVAASTAIVKVNGGFVSNGGIAQLPPASAMDQTKANILDSLKSMGVDGSTLESVDAADREGVIRQYQFGLYVMVGNAVRRKGAAPSQPVIDALNTGTPEGYRKALQLSGVTDADVLPYIEDLEYYMKYTKQRRPEVWAGRDTWPANFR
jgi:hypothetical protein